MWGDTGSQKKSASGELGRLRPLLPSTQPNSGTASPVAVPHWARERLPDKLAVQRTNPPGVSHEGLVGLLREFGLNLKGLVERARAGEFFDKALRVRKRLFGVVAVSGRDRLQADRRGIRRCGRTGRRGIRRCGCADRGGV